MRGRHFGFLGCLFSIWIAARVGFLSTAPALGELKAGAAEIAPTKVENGGYHRAGTTSSQHADVTNSLFLARRKAVVGSPKAALSQTVTPNIELDHLTVPTARTFPAFSPFPILPRSTESRSAAWSIYTYSFFRSGSQIRSLADGGQYGGSQSGFVASLSLDNDNSLALLLRGAIAHQRLAERELAAGLRWAPVRSLPVSVSAERRFRNASDDAFAFYLSGGQSGLDLPLKFQAEGFAQAGFVSGQDSGPFFDMVARARRDLDAGGKSPLALGAGVWGGGQSNIFRIDAGPTIGTEIPLGKTRLRIDADWRFRVAGDVKPGDGPALTLSTSF